MVKITKPRKKEKKEKEKKRKKNREPKKSTGKDVGQSNSKEDKQTLKEKKKEKKKASLVQEQNFSLSSLSSSGITPLASNLVCLLWRFGASIWCCWNPLVAGGGWCASRLVGWRPGRLAGGWWWHVGGGPPVLSVYRDMENTSTG
jgi:hypothetical protein